MAKKKLDFTGTDKEIKRGGGGGRHIPPGEYKVKIIEGEYFKGDRDKGSSPGYRWLCQVVEGKYKGTKLRGFTSLKPEALWSLRNLIHAATGKNVAGKTVSFDPDSLEGKIVGAEVEDNEYKKGNKTKLTSQINTFFPKDEVNASDDDEDEDDDEEEEEDEDEDDEDDDLEDVEVEEI